MICVRAPALSAAGTVHPLLVVAPRVAPSGRRLVPASMRSECLHHAAVVASFRVVWVAPLDVMLPAPPTLPLWLTSHGPLPVALTLPVAIALLPRLAGLRPPRIACIAGQAWPAARVRLNASWRVSMV